MKSILEALDFTPFHLPTIEVEPVRSSEVTDIFSALDQFTDIVFVSRNAVEIGMHFVNHHGGMPESCRVMTVGAETAKQLYRHGIDAMFPQHGTGAEALLGVGQLTDLTGQNILLVRGDGGLDWPAQEMQSRGAQVQEVRCYKQKLPENSLALMQKCASDKIGVAGVFVHSANSAVHLIDLAKQKYPELLYAILVAGSQRIATKALELGWRGEIRVADSPSNKHMMICFSQPEDSSV
ncbi:MAG: uroporphyrinogen-III synthase [Pseudomonadota bacterium]